MTLPYSPETPLPTPAQYEWSARMADKAIDESADGIERYLFHRTRMMRDAGQVAVNVMERADKLGKALEPRHHATGKRFDRESRTRNMTKSGASGGLFLIERLHGNTLATQDLFEYAGLDMNIKDASYLNYNIQKIGEQGLDLIGESTVAFIERWQELLTDDPKRGKLFCHMVGLIALGGYNAHVAYNNDQVKQLQTREFSAKYKDYGVDSPGFDDELNKMLGR